MASAKTSTQERVVLCVNIGNAVTKLGIYQGAVLAATWVVTTPDDLTLSEVETVLMNFAASLKSSSLAVEAEGATVSLEEVSGSIIASVVPNITEKWATALMVRLGRRPFMVGPGLKTGIKLGYSDPAEIGADRIADAVAARKLFGAPVIIINMETTTTFEVIDKDGNFAGGIIAPGLEISARELSNNAAKIPVIDIKAPKTVVGKSTREAVQAGVVMGEVARIDGLVGMIWRELGYQTKVIAAGANTKLIQMLSENVDECIDNLTLRGLKELYDLNAK